MKSSKLMYAIVRTHGLKTRLIQPSFLESIIKADSMSDVRDILLKTDYSQDVGVIPEVKVDASTFETVFQQKILDRYSFILDIVPRNMLDFLEAYIKRFEVENVKRVLRAKSTGKKINASDLIFIGPRTDINFSIMMEATELDSAVTLLKETMYGPLDAYFRRSEKKYILPILEALLDKIYYINAWEKLDPLGDPNMTDLFGHEVDAKNINTAITLKMRGVESKNINEVLIPLYFGVTESAINRLIEYEQVESLRGTRYLKIAEEIKNHVQKGKTGHLEHLLNSFFYHQSELQFQKQPLGMVFIFAYLIICEREARNLTTIVTAKELNISEEIIREQLY